VSDGDDPGIEFGRLGINGSWFEPILAYGRKAGLEFEGGTVFEAAFTEERALDWPLSCCFRV
jgi:hypothetical protein